jgi:hypothetical protein
VAGAIPGWRSAILLHDPLGIGARIQHEARAWSWDAIAEESDRWVARDITQLCEEVGKLLNAIVAHESATAAIRMNHIIDRLLRTMAVRHRVLPDSERFLIQALEGVLGAEWHGVVHAALGIGGQALADRITATLSLFKMAVADCLMIFDADQQDVCKHMTNSVVAYVKSRQG